MSDPTRGPFRVKTDSSNQPVQGNSSTLTANREPSLILKLKEFLISEHLILSTFDSSTEVPTTAAENGTVASAVKASEKQNSVTQKQLANHADRNHENKEDQLADPI